MFFELRQWGRTGTTGSRSLSERPVEERDWPSGRRDDRSGSDQDHTDRSDAEIGRSGDKWRLSYASL